MQVLVVSPTGFGFSTLNPTYKTSLLQKFNQKGTHHQ